MAKGIVKELEKEQPVIKVPENKKHMSVDELELYLKEGFKKLDHLLSQMTKK